MEGAGVEGAVLEEGVEAELLSVVLVVAAAEGVSYDVAAAGAAEGVCVCVYWYHSLSAVMEEAVVAAAVPSVKGCLP